MKYIISLLLFPLFTIILFIKPAQAQIITTIAGNGVGGFSGDNGPAINASIGPSRDVAVDDSSNVYIADTYNFCIRKIDRNGIITTVAGTPTVFGFSGDHGPATIAQLDDPYGIAVDKKHNLYIADEGNYCIRKVDTAGIITTFAGTPTVNGFSGDNAAATAALLSAVWAVAADKAGNIYMRP